MRATALSLFAALYFATSSVHAKILDPDAPADPILTAIEIHLDALGIDAVQGTAFAEASAERPRLSTMRGFRAKERDWAEFKSEWTLGFAEGMVGALLAVRPSRSEATAQLCSTAPPSVSQKVCDFLESWRRAPSQQRVFVAFTRADRTHAERVQKALETAGYVVFLYLRSDQEDAWAEPDLVGSLFTESGSRYVLDTENARNSDGVRFEAKACEFLLTPPVKPSAIGAWYRSLSES